MPISLLIPRATTTGVSTSGRKVGGLLAWEEGMFGELGEANNASYWNGEQSVAPRSQMEVRGGRLSPPNQITEKREAEGIDPNFC